MIPGAGSTASTVPVRSWLRNRSPMAYRCGWRLVRSIAPQGGGEPRFLTCLLARSSWASSSSSLCLQSTAAPPNDDGVRLHVRYTHLGDLSIHQQGWGETCDQHQYHPLGCSRGNWWRVKDKEQKQARRKSHFSYYVYRAHVCMEQPSAVRDLGVPPH